MSEAAAGEITQSGTEPAMPEAQESASEEVAQDDYIPGLDPDPELPDFNIYDEEGDEPQAETAESQPTVEGKKTKADQGWSARVRKDRAQRKKEIEIKRREQELSQRETSVRNEQQLRDAFMANPEKFLEAQGVDPLEFFADWTNRISTGINNPSENTRISSTERELKELKQELQKRDQARLANHTAQEQQAAINQYYSQVDEFVKSSNDYPLTKEQCTAPDIAQGIAAYYQQTGVELGFDEACKMIEDGLSEKENNIFNDPAIVAKFKKYHGLDASNSKGRRSHLTLSSNLQAQPTKTPAEDMSEDEIYDFWKGKLFT